MFISLETNSQCSLAFYLFIDLFEYLANPITVIVEGSLNSLSENLFLKVNEALHMVVAKMKMTSILTRQTTFEPVDLSPTGARHIVRASVTRIITGRLFITVGFSVTPY